MAKDNFDTMAATLLELVGGKDNVTFATHCATRLRLNLKDRSLVKDDEIKKTSGVLGLAESGGQFQIIIGPEVSQLYPRLQNLLGEKQAVSGEGEKPKEKWYNAVINTLTGIFTPILPALTASGMIKAVLAILIAFKLVNNQSMTYQVLNFMGDATFYFLPVLLANSAAKKLGCNPFLAMMLGGILVHPNFVALVTAAKADPAAAVSIFGLPIYNATYSSSVIPILLGVLLMSKVEPFANKISPKPIKFFTAPLITMFVCGIATLCVLGPVGYIIGNFLGKVVNGLNDIAPWLVSTIVGALLPFLVMTGTHHALTPIGINNRMTIGFDAGIYPGQLASNVAQGGAALGAALRSKNTDFKSLASATGITAVCGITEPVLFGVTIHHKTNMLSSMVGGAAGGFFLGLFQVKNFSGGAPGLLTLPSYIGLDAPMSNFYLACAGAAIAFAVAFVLSFLLHKDAEEKA